MGASGLDGPGAGWDAPRPTEGGPCPVGGGERPVHPVDRPLTRGLAPGVTLHVLPTRRFTTAWCRVALPRRPGRDVSGTSLLASVLEAATERHPTREALAWALADLGGATLGVSVGRLGDAHVLSASLEWPLAGLGRREDLLGKGLRLLGDVLARPKRERPGRDDLDEGIVSTERQNLAQSLAAVRDDKARYALRRLLETACEGEPYATDALGRTEDLPGIDPRGLSRLHARLLARSPVVVFLAGDVDPAAAVRSVRRHLLWPRRAAGVRRFPRAAAVRRARAVPRRVVERDTVQQTRLALAWRAPVGPRSPLLPAAVVLAGVLGGGSFSRLFKVVRETDGLCYDASAAWHAAKGLLTVEAGVDEAERARAVRRVRSLVAEVAAGRLDARSLHGFAEAVRSRFEALGDDRASIAAWSLDALLLGIDPDPEAYRRRLAAVDARAVRAVGRRLGAEASYALAPRPGRRP